MPEDNSFESNFPIPVAMDQSDGHDPLPLGDEVSMGVISRESENMSRNGMHMHHSQPPMPNPNRVQGTTTSTDLKYENWQWAKFLQPQNRVQGTLALPYY